MRLGVTIIGDIRKDMLADAKRLARAVKQGAIAAGNGLKNEYRGQVRSAGLGNKVANAWRSAVYPKTGDSANAAASVWTKAPHIIDAHEKGTIIRSRNGFWLAIPTENAPKRGTGGKRISPSTFPEHSLGKLRFVYLGAGRGGILVVDNLRASYSRKTGEMRGFRRASARALSKGQTASAVMFVLVPQVRARKTLDVQGPIGKWGREFVRQIDQGLAGQT